MHCVECDAKLGRVFVTTTRDMDRFRDNFTFDSPSLGSFKLGSCTLRSARGVLAEACGGGAGGTEADDAAKEAALLLPKGHAMVLVGDSVNHFVQLKDELLKIQNVVLGLHKRLATLEGAEP